jgi:cyanate permease
MTDQHATESPGFGRSARRTLDSVLVVGALLSPVIVLVRNGWDAVALSWSVLLELATLLWLLYLARRPRRPLAGAVLPDGRSAPKSGSKQQKRKRR